MYSNMSFDDSRRLSHEPRGTGLIYRRAILLVLKSLNDFKTRSNIDAVRRHTQTILEDDGYIWNEVLFFKTMKSIDDAGDIDICSKVAVELSPEYKIKVIKKFDSAVERKQESTRENRPYMFPVKDTHQTTLVSVQQHSLSSLQPNTPFLPSQPVENVNLDPENVVMSPITPIASPNQHLKPLARRRSEHDKWKIIPKSIYDKTL